MKSFENSNHEGNSSKYHTGKKCISCNNPAGTAWSPLWCFECNVRRIKKINSQLENLTKGEQQEATDEKE